MDHVYFILIIINNVYNLQSLEAQKLEFVAKEKQRMQEALMKSQKEEEEKAKAAQAKLRRSMEITKENRELQIMSLQEKLREHVSVGCIDV